MVNTDWKGRAVPGKWYGNYHAAWNAAHPGAWMRGELETGGFYAGDVWASSTLDWDREWFAQQDVRMPKKYRHVDPSPGGIRLASTLGPGESASFTIGIEE